MDSVGSSFFELGPVAVVVMLAGQVLGSAVLFVWKS